MHIDRRLLRLARTENISMIGAVAFGALGGVAVESRPGSWRG